MARKKKNKHNVAPFIWVGVLWAGLGVGIGLYDASTLQINWFLAIWALAMLDLAALFKLVASIMFLMTEAKESQKGPATLQTAFWGFSKVACLAFLGVLLYSARTNSAMTLVLGGSTLVSVPLIGGFWWSQKELS